MHKIDRDKLREAIRLICGPLPLVTDDFVQKYGEHPLKVLGESAENWLEISDPDYEPSNEMVTSGSAFIAALFLGLSEKIGLTAVKSFKAMIAKAGE